jgi:hypothetical protein
MLYMTSPLHQLKGLKITNVIDLHSYVQIHFGTEIGLSIYNDRFITPETTNVQNLVGKSVTSIIEDDDFIIFEFLDGARLNIDMRRQAYHGAEALQLNRRGTPPIIWN